MQDLNAIYAFVHVVQHQGFSAASRVTHLPKSTLSRQISQLEQQLGTRLLQRSTRQLTLTDIGQQYFEQCLQVLQAADAAQALIDQHHVEPQGVIRLSCPAFLLHFLVAGMLARYLARYPKIELILDSTNRQVDVRREGIDIALTLECAPSLDGSLIRKPLSANPHVWVAQPQWLGSQTPIHHPQDLASLPLLYWGLSQAQYHTRLIDAQGEAFDLHFCPRLVTDDVIMLRRACLEGLGVVCLPRLAVFKDLHEGRLVQILPDWQPPAHQIVAYFASRQGLLPSVRGLLDSLADEFAALDMNQLYARYHGNGDADACLLVAEDCTTPINTPSSSR